MEKKYNFHGKRILIVEDLLILREMEAKRLSLIGFEVDQASNGKEAVEKYKAHETWYYQAILMDIIMPEMDGRQASLLIRSLNRKDSLCIPIISISSDNSDQAIEESLAAGIDLFIDKPIDFLQLFTTLEKAIKNNNILVNGITTTSKSVNSNRYAKLWKLLIDKKMTKTHLRESINCSTVTLAKLGKGEKVSSNILAKICQTLNCNLDDIVDDIE